MSAEIETAENLLQAMKDELESLDMDDATWHRKSDAYIKQNTKVIRLRRAARLEQSKKAFERDRTLKQIVMGGLYSEDKLQ